MRSPQAGQAGRSSVDWALAVGTFHGLLFLEFVDAVLVTRTRPAFGKGDDPATFTRFASDLYVVGTFFEDDGIGFRTRPHLEITAEENVGAGE